jgi:hypothetical protein
MYSLNLRWYSRSSFNLRLSTLHLQAHKPQAKKATDKQVNVSFRASAFCAGVILSFGCFLATAPKKQNMDIKQANNVLRTMAFMTQIS